MTDLHLHCCIHIPAMRLQVIEYHRPELAKYPFAIASQTQGILAVIELLSPAARRLRIPHGIRISDLQARWPQVPIVSPALEQEQRLIREMEALSDSQTPIHRFEDDTLFLDLSGTSRLHGSDRITWARRFLDTLARHTGLQHFRAAFAPTAHTAEILARANRQSTPIFCAAGQEQEMLAKIPLRLLHRFPPRLHTRFRLYNLSTLGDIQRLERQFLQNHFGSEGEQLYAIARGLNLTATHLSSHGPLNQRSIFPRDTANEQQIFAEHHKLCDQLCIVLRQQRCTARQLRFVLQYSDGQESSNSHKWEKTTDDFQEILSASTTMLQQALQRRIAVRSIELIISQPVQSALQIDLFQADGQRQTSRGNSLDKVRQKPGFNAVINGNAPLAPSTKHPAKKRAVPRAS